MARNARPTKTTPAGKSQTRREREDARLRAEDARTRAAARGPADTSGLPPSPDMAPHESARRMADDHAPVDDPHPNAAMLKADVDSGRTGDKNEVFDPGMSMLGTDDEVAGTPASPERLRLAREDQARHAPKTDAPAKGSIARTGNRKVVVGFVAGIVVFAVAFAVVVLGV